MKHQILQKAAALCVGAAVALTAVSARADEPKNTDDTVPKHHHKHVAKKVAHMDEASTPTRNQFEKKNNAAPIPTKDGRNATYSAGGPIGGSNGAEHAVLTGSQLPRSYNRRGYSTDSNDSHFIYDQNDIRLQSTNSVGDSLRSVPGVHVRGGTQ